MTRPTKEASSSGPADDAGEAFRALYQQYYPRVRRFFMARGFSPEDSQDLAQDTFIRVFRGIGSFQHTARFESWLFQIATNVYRNELRRWAAGKRLAAVEFSIEALLAPESAPMQAESEPLMALEHGVRSPELPLALASVEPTSLDRALAQERSRALSNALDVLPPQARRCVEFRLYQGLKYREIAEVLKISIETVKSHLHQAQELLKRELDEHLT